MVSYEISVGSNDCFPLQKPCMKAEDSLSSIGDYQLRYIEDMYLCGVQCIRWYSESLALFVLIQEEKGFLYIFEF